MLDRSTPKTFSLFKSKSFENAHTLDSLLNLFGLFSENFSFGTISLRIKHSYFPHMRKINSFYGNSCFKCYVIRVKWINDCITIFADIYFQIMFISPQNYTKVKKVFLNRILTFFHRFQINDAFGCIDYTNLNNNNLNNTIRKFYNIELLRCHEQKFNVV